MENASKALLIAGGVLIALIILAMLLAMFNSMSNIQKEQEEQIKIEQIAAFNSEFEAYNKKVMYGTDVITLINKVAENNKKYLGNSNYQIVVILNGTQIDDSSELIAAKFEKNICECINIDYNSLGRVCKIEIKNKY